MSEGTYRQKIQRNAAIIAQLHRNNLETHALRDQGAEQMAAWNHACSEFRNNYEALAFPGGTLGARDRMRSGDNEAIEYAIAFLEVRPYFFRSGYMYQEFMRVLRNCPLSDSQRRRYDRVREKYLVYRAGRRRST